jgi:hypothetical protein
MTQLGLYKVAIAGCSRSFTMLPNQECDDITKPHRAGRCDLSAGGVLRLWAGDAARMINPFHHRSHGLMGHGLYCTARRSCRASESPH